MGIQTRVMRPRRARGQEPESVTVVAPGIYRMHRASVNCYLIETRDGLTLVDAGLPGMWRTLLGALEEIGAAPSDISGILLTHGHFDHVGLCDRLGGEHSVTSHVHELDAELVRHPYRYSRQASRWRYPLRYPRAIPILAALTAAGALTVKGWEATNDLQPDEPVQLPGSPVPLWTPGHTNGHCAFVLPDRGIVFSGDALVTLDPYTGLEGPRLVARAATADVETNIVSLQRLSGTGAALVLPGHGLPYEEGIHKAVRAALLAGSA